MTSMFWGLRLEPGKRYSTTVDKSFHVSMAALDCGSVKSDKEVLSVMLEEGESNIPFILCNLHKPEVLQSHLDLNFVSGDRVTFFCRGNGTVHLTGYVMPEDDDDDFANFGEGEEVEEEEEEDEEEEGEEVKEVSGKGKSKVNGLPSNKRKGEVAVGLPDKKKKPSVPELGDSEEASEDDDDEMDEEDETGEEEDDEEEEMESEDESEEDAEEEEKIPLPTPTLEQKGKKKKKNKPDAQQPVQLSPSKQQQQQGKAKQLNGPQQQNAAQQKKKQQQQPLSSNEKAAESQQSKKTLEGGVSVKDIKVGNGPICKPGRMVTVYYTGRLKSNNKVFDQTQQGPGFKFRVGRGEVIKGWDVGLAGMKVGGKRLITCPPSMAYGAKGSPPTIPGNSTLMFEVELKAVN